MLRSGSASQIVPKGCLFALSSRFDQMYNQ
jgi:hypothetical protein